MRDSRKTFLNVLVDNLFNLLNLAIVALCVIFVLNKSYFYLIPLSLSIICSIFNFSLDIKHYLISHKDKQTVHIIRDGNEAEISITKIKLGDEIVLYPGQNISFVGKVKAGYLLVDEKYINGKSAPTKKGPGSSIIRESYILEGNAVVEVIETGKRYARKTKVQKLALTKHMKLVNLILSGVTLLCLLVALIFDLINKTEILNSFAKCLVIAIPSVLYIVLTIYLFSDTRRLNSSSVKVIDPMFLTELKDVDVVCLDKTGTITTGEFEIFKTVSLSSTAFASMSIDSSRAFEQCVSNILKTTKETGGYYSALQERFIYDVTKTISASSPIKVNGLYSAITIANGNTYALGEVDNFELTNADSAIGHINQYRNLGYHVLLLVESKKPLKSGLIDGKCTAIGLIVLQEKIRENIKDLIAYCMRNGIDVKVISGDRLPAVAEACRKVGFEIQGKTLSVHGLPFEELEHIVDDQAVFTDASASQKAYIVKKLKQKGHKVAYIGDGNNDTQALKTANIAISMNSSVRSVNKCVHAIIYETFTLGKGILNISKSRYFKLTSVITIMLAQSIFATFFAVAFLIAHSFDPIIIDPFEVQHIWLWILIGIIAPAILILCEKDGKKFKEVDFFRNLLGNSFAFIAPIGTLYILQLMQFNGIGYFSLPGDRTDLHELLITSSVTNNLSYLALVVASMFVVYNHFNPFNKYRSIALISLLVLPLAYGVLLGFSIDNLDFITHIETSNLTAMNYFTMGFVVIISSSAYLLVMFLLNLLKGQNNDVKSEPRN